MNPRFHPYKEELISQAYHILRKWMMEELYIKRNLSTEEIEEVLERIVAKFTVDMYQVNWKEIKLVTAPGRSRYYKIEKKSVADIDELLVNLSNGLFRSLR